MLFTLFLIFSETTSRWARRSAQYLSAGEYGYRVAGFSKWGIRDMEKLSPRWTLSRFTCEHFNDGVHRSGL